MTLDLRTASASDRTRREYGLDTQQQVRIHEMLHAYDDRLSLRRIPERDPAYRPPRIFGVYEEGTHGAESPWVLTVEELSIDERLVARVIMGDMTKTTPRERMEALKKAQALAEEHDRKRREEEALARREEMAFIAGSSRTSLRHRINGEKVVLGDTLHSGRTYV